MTALETPKRALLSIRITEISNGFLVTCGGEHTFVTTYEEALMSLPAPSKPQPISRRKSK